MVDIANLAEKLNQKFKGELELSESGNAIYSRREHLVQLMTTLKDEYKFNRLADLTAADYTDCYEVVYHLLNDSAELLCIKIKLGKNDCKVPTISPLWQSADPQEREAYDLLGIVFEGHSHLTRILCPDDFVGHPLRKDYKLNPPERFQGGPGKGVKLNVINGR